MKSRAVKLVVPVSLMFVAATSLTPAFADPAYAVWCFKATNLDGRLYNCTVSRGGGIAPIRHWMAYGPAEGDDALAWLRQYCTNVTNGEGWLCPGSGTFYPGSPLNPQ
jgi:hypothetical protein